MLYFIFIRKNSFINIKNEVNNILFIYKKNIKNYEVRIIINLRIGSIIIYKII